MKPFMNNTFPSDLLSLAKQFSVRSLCNHTRPQYSYPYMLHYAKIKNLFENQQLKSIDLRTFFFFCIGHDVDRPRDCLRTTVVNEKCHELLLVASWENILRAEHA